MGAQDCSIFLSDPLGLNTFLLPQAKQPNTISFPYLLSDLVQTLGQIGEEGKGYVLVLLGQCQACGVSVDVEGTYDDVLGDEGLHLELVCQVLVNLCPDLELALLFPFTLCCKPPASIGMVWLVRILA